MVVYLDLAFLLNALADGLALYITARMAGIGVGKRKIILSAVLGGLYGAVCLVPGLAAMGGFFPQMAAGAGLVRLAFGDGRDFLRRFLLFFIVSCTISGALVAFAQMLEGTAWPKGQENLNWNVFFLVGIMCYVLLSVMFRGGAKHAVAGQLCRGVVERKGRSVEFTALLDTGHTLTDGAGDRSVLIIEHTALYPLWSEQERAVLGRLPLLGAADCFVDLGVVSPGKFRLLPYRAVGVSTGMLLCFRADQLILDGVCRGEVTVAISPTAVSDGGGYTALWGGEITNREAPYAA